MLVVFGVLLLLYPLSTGPAVKLSEKGVISKKAVVFCYTPLDFLRRRSHVVKRFFEWYLEDVWKVN
jgi:hypothetical protein